jgi:alpha-beta hydrolase superfamily lysophospholipase
MSKSRLSRVTVDGVELFYREAGPADAPAILLLHGFPTSSHMFRDLIPELAGRYRVVAPDLPGTMCMLGRVTASQIASASAASVLPRLT